MSTKRVLIVDDEPNLRSTLADILVDEGYHVQTGRSGEEAVELCSSQIFDVLIMDFKMPGLSGMEVLRELSSTGSPERVILMSAYAMEDLKREALNQGALAFLDKPLDLDNLLDLVRNANLAAVLIISDDPQTCDWVDELKQHGYRVAVAHSARLAIELSQQIQFKVLLIDYCLSSGSGLDTYLALKPVARHADAIMLTGTDEQSRACGREAVKHAAFTCLDRPKTPATLLPILQQLTGQQVTVERLKPLPFE
jgi:DNA-binding NtrC family response regulator